ncbi:efflux RND transporter periplasmic adaptor subunit [Salinarimonas sp.]|uniref:efflux RND transporter periplasmic adaptor subunit n=1 Tax=Salinarimonas sp. TaxID=2766526 RepID=UPI0032D9A5BA
MQRATKRRLSVAAGVLGAFILGLVLAALIGEPVTSRVQSAAGAVQSLVSGGEEEESGEGQERPPTAVTFAAVETGVAEELYRAVGEVAAENRVRVTPSVPGIVESVEIGDGERVAEGDTLVLLDNDQQEVALDAAQAALTQAREAYERTQTLIEDGYATEAELERDRTAFIEARADVERARQMLDDRAVRAPFAGEVGIVAVDEGAYVQPGEMLASLATTGDLVVRVSVPPLVARGLSPGDAVTVEGPQGETYDAKIASVSPLADPRSRTVAVEAAIPEPGALRPGSFASVSLVEARRENALFVPAEAILLQGQLAFVFKPTQEMTAERRRVEVGVRRAGRVEIREGLLPGDRVVVEGKQKLSAGMRIAPAGEGGPSGGPPDGGARQEANAGESG